MTRINKPGQLISPKVPNWTTRSLPQPVTLEGR